MTTSFWNGKWSVWFWNGNLSVWFLMLMIFNLNHLSFGRYPTKDELRCGACKLLIEELEISINEVDQKKMIEVGSFRVDPKGNLKLSEVPYARSEMHLHELVEEVCDKAKNYGFTLHPTTDRPTFIRLNDPDGQRRKIIADISSVVTNRLKFACDGIMEEHEEDIIKQVTKDYVGALEKFCVQQTNFCKAADLVPFPYDLEALEPLEFAAGSKSDAEEEL